MTIPPWPATYPRATRVAGYSFRQGDRDETGRLLGALPSLALVDRARRGSLRVRSLSFTTPTRGHRHYSPTPTGPQAHGLLYVCTVLGLSVGTARQAEAGKGIWA
jgi:hypothetical protein